MCVCVKYYIKKTACFQCKPLFCFAIVIKTLHNSSISVSLTVGICALSSLVVSWHLCMHAFTLSDLGLLCMQWGFFTLKVETKGGGRHVQHVMETETLFRVKEMDQQREGWKERKGELHEAGNLPSGPHHSIMLMLLFLPSFNPTLFFVSPVPCCFLLLLCF